MVIKYFVPELLLPQIIELHVARSKADFISKLAIVEEEADETLFWLEILEEIEILDKNLIVPLVQENDEIIAIIVSSIKTSRKRK